MGKQTVDGSMYGVALRPRTVARAFVVGVQSARDNRLRRRCVSNGFEIRHVRRWYDSL